MGRCREEVKETLSLENVLRMSTTTSYDSGTILVPILLNIVVSLVWYVFDFSYRIYWTRFIIASY